MERKDHRDPTAVCSLGCFHTPEEILGALAALRGPLLKPFDLLLVLVCLPLLAGLVLLDSNNTVNIFGRHWNFKNYHFFIWDWTIIEIGVIVMMLIFLIRIFMNRRIDKVEN